MKISQCWKCHAKVWFATTPLGKTVAVNTWASPNGKIVPMDPDADKPLVRYLKKGEEPTEGEKRYVPHMGTCKARR